MAHAFSHFSKNGEIRPIEEAVIPVSNIEYSYGYGVYETLKYRHNTVYFIDQHVARLMHSAEQLDLVHPYTAEQVTQYIQELMKTIEGDACNIKILLIGGREPLLFILALAPLFPDRKLYSRGAKTITVEYERLYPNVKSLNMLGSYMAYKKAKAANCYDGLLINKNKEIVEGTRTNFFAIKGKTLYTPPLSEVLEGVTRQTVLYTAKKHGYQIREEQIPLANIADYDGAFITSTSSKIVPIITIDDFEFPEISPELKELIKLYDAFLDASEGKFPKDLVF